jgi:BirA family biotin operon repressor/biotin-[acetyl-CoA-carboxylase] ligase
LNSSLLERFGHPQPLPEEMRSALADAASRLGIVHDRVAWYAEVTSTNDVAHAHAEVGAPEGSTIIADGQTAGRGRLGRTWISPRGAGLYVSIVLRPNPASAALLTLGAGVAIADGIRDATGLAPALKWPNDVWVGRRKLGGILAETGSSARGLEHVVLGFGINVSKAAYPPEVAPRATSLEEELGRRVDRGVLLAECLCAVAARYQQLGMGKGPAVLTAWRASAQPLMRQPVEWDQHGRPCQGIAEDVDETGALLVATATGLERIVAGEVRWA